MGVPGNLTLLGVPVVDGRGVRAERADIRVENGRIASIDAPAPVVSAADRVFELASMIGRGELVGPRMLAVGRVVTITGGHGHWIGIEADGPDAVRRAVRTLIKEGATATKLMATGGMMTAGRQAGVPQLTVEE